jgi:hypothetical protein
MNLKSLAIRFAESHPQYRYDMTNHVWVGVSDGELVYPTAERIPGAEVDALARPMAEAHDFGRHLRKMPCEFAKPLRVACAVRPPKRNVVWHDAERLAKNTPAWVLRRYWRGRNRPDGMCLHFYHSTVDLEINVMPDNLGSEWRAFFVGDPAVKRDIEHTRFGSFCRHDVLRRALNANPWLAEGKLGPLA